MAHVELSLSEPPTSRALARSPLDNWAAAVAEADEPCLVLDADGVIVALSASCRTLLGLPRPPVAPRSPAGRARPRPPASPGLLHEAIRLLDFSSSGGALGDGELSKIPPLLALTSGRLSRGLLRVESGDGACTLDAVATPLLDGRTVVGSLTFFSAV